MATPGRRVKVNEGKPERTVVEIEKAQAAKKDRKTSGDEALIEKSRITVED